MSPVPVFTRRLLPALTVSAGILLSACSTAPLSPYSEDTPPLILLPASQAGVADERGRFREVFCEVLEARGQTLPDYRPCEQALTRVGAEPEGTGSSVNLGRSESGLVAMVVPGVGWDCFDNGLKRDHSAKKHIRQFGFEMVIPKVDAMSSSAVNARQIRDTIVAMDSDDDTANLVLIGYSKGSPDILEAVVAYPENRQPHPRPRVR
jgi:hypothetical protein